MSTILTGIMIPFFGTAAGAGCVYFLRDGLNDKVQKALLGFASGGSRPFAGHGFPLVP